MVKVVFIGLTAVFAVLKSHSGILPVKHGAYLSGRCSAENTVIKSVFTAIPTPKAAAETWEKLWQTV